MILNHSSRTFYNILSLSHIGLSLFGLGLLTVLTFNFPTSVVNFPFQKQLTSSILAAICLLGIIVGVFPSGCSRMLHFRGRDKNSNKMGQTTPEVTTIRFMGHHPTCGNFSAHVLQLRGKMYCAGCTGLVIGAVISIFGCFSYSFFDFYVGETSVFIFWAGFVAVVCGLLQYHILDVNRGAVYFFLNVTFVLGAFLLLVGINEITGNFALETYLFTLIIYWIITRIITSQLKHRKVCATCSLKSCSYL